MPDLRREFGTAGERMAADLLQKKGFSIIARQVRTPFGEIDLVCQDGDEVVFVEVKTRRTETFGPPEESVTLEKLRHVARSAEAYLLAQAREASSWRIDVVAIWVREDGEPDIVHFEAVDTAAGF